MKIVHVSGGPLNDVWSDEFIAAIEARGELTIHAETGPLRGDASAELVRPHDVVIVGWNSHGLPKRLAVDPGELKYVLSYSGSIRLAVPRELVEAGMLVSNWGDLPALGIAESAMTLLLTAIHDMRTVRRAQEAGAWGYQSDTAATLNGLAVGIYGLGVIGRQFVEMLRPFGARIRAHDPYVTELPAGVERADSLEALCDWAEALVIHAGLSDETTGSVTADHLGRLLDGGVVINTARGAIIDQDALFAELETGRLRAGLDVLHPDGKLAPDHPLRNADNVTFSFHQLTSEDSDPWPPRPGLSRMQQRVIDQLDRFAAGEKPEFLFDLDRYDRST